MDILTGGYGRGVPDERNQVPPSARFDLQDRESGIGIVERDTFDAADEGLAIWRLFLSFLANRALLSEELEQVSLGFIKRFVAVGHEHEG
jgi:hypothetical protein